MKKLMFALACAIVFAANLANAATLEDKITFGGKTSHKLSIFESKSFGESAFGWSAYFLTGQYWSEGYVGPTWTPAPWVSLSASVGVQSAKSGENPTRYASSAWVGNKFGSLYAVYERGAEASNNWWKAKAFANVAKGVKVGVFFEKDVDVAPVLELSIPETRLVVWGAYYASGSQLGLKYNF